MKFVILFALIFAPAFTSLSGACPHCGDDNKKLDVLVCSDCKLACGDCK